MRALATVVAIAAASSLTCAHARPVPAAIASRSICSALRTAEPPSGKELVVHGTYRTSFEVSDLYCVACFESGIPWVDFAEDVELPPGVRLDALGGTVNVIFEGHLETGGGFGHLNAYPARFFVRRVLKAEPVGKIGFVPSHLPARERASVCQQ